ncbi:hypothetical protein C8Q75DRAFT_411705 [Abortiporus biennis]|nr:hypothetical protein C8Q75DRAFT_411705 [Abortiporus biennis]
MDASDVFAEIHPTSISNPDRYAPDTEGSRARKRAPLPPQSERFRQASKKPVPQAPANFSAVPSNTDRTVRPGEPPSGPRNLSQAPPTRPSGRRGSRFDNSANGQPAVGFPVDSMEIDRPARNIPSGESNFSDRYAQDPQFSSVPKGPRAMVKSNPPQHVSAPGAYGNTRPLPSEPSAAVRMRNRAPPPHMTFGPGGRPLGTPFGPGNDTVEPAPRRYEGVPDGPSQLRQNQNPVAIEARVQDVRDPTKRGGRMKLTGTNNVPIGNRRSHSSTPVQEVPPQRSPVDRSRPLPSTFDVNPERYEAKPQDDYSPASHNRSLPLPQNEAGYRRQQPVVPNRSNVEYRTQNLSLEEYPNQYPRPDDPYAQDDRRQSHPRYIPYGKKLSSQ